MWQNVKTAKQPAPSEVDFLEGKDGKRFSQPRRCAKSESRKWRALDSKSFGNKISCFRICDRYAKIAILKNIQVIKEKEKKTFAMEVSTKTFCGWSATRLGHSSCPCHLKPKDTHGQSARTSMGLQSEPRRSQNFHERFVWEIQSIATGVFQCSPTHSKFVCLSQEALHWLNTIQIKEPQAWKTKLAVTL